MKEGELFPAFKQADREKILFKRIDKALEIMGICRLVRCGCESCTTGAESIRRKLKLGRLPRADETSDILILQGIRVRKWRTQL